MKVSDGMPSYYPWWKERTFNSTRAAGSAAVERRLMTWQPKASETEKV